MAYAIAISQPGGVENLHRISIEPPQPKAGEVLIRHTAIGLNFIDVYFRTGAYPWPVERDLITGSEAAGVIEAVGEGVSLAVGQRVAYVAPNGAYATHRTIDASQVVQLPDDISDEMAAGSMLKGLTAHYLIHHSYPASAGETVLFHAAAGGVGLIAGQWLKSRGVHTIGTAGGPEKCALAKNHGYEQVIDYRNEDFVARTMELTKGAGVAAVYDSVGKDTVAKSLKVLERFGTIVCFGQSSGPVDDFKINDLAIGSLRLTRPTVFQHIARPGWLQQASADLFRVISKGDVKTELGGQFPLINVAAAHSALESRQTTGSTVLIP